MADIKIDTTNGQYQSLLSGLGTLRTVLGPRLNLLKRLRHSDRREGTDKVRQWLDRDPLLRRVVIMARKLNQYDDMGLIE